MKIIKVNFKYGCHDCGDESRLFSCTVGEHEYDLCENCIKEREEENNEEE